MPNTQTCAPALVAPSRYSEVNYSAFNYNFTDCVLFTRASVAEIFNAKLISLKEKKLNKNDNKGLQCSGNCDVDVALSQLNT